MLEGARPADLAAAPLTMVNAERLVDCPFSLALEQAHLIFATLEAPGPGVRIPLRAFGIPFGGSFAYRVTARFHREPDLMERGRAHDEVHFTWSAPSGWLPNFHGILRMRIENAETRLILQGDYVPPFGPIGASFDRLIGRRFARATAAELIDRLGRALEARWVAAKRDGAD